MWAFVLMLGIAAYKDINYGPLGEQNVKVLGIPQHRRPCHYNIGVQYNQINSRRLVNAGTPDQPSTIGSIS